MAGNDFASMFEEASPRGKTPRLEAGAQVEGTVLEISGGLVVVDIGGTADATIDLGEFEDRPIKVGDRIQATVANPRPDGPLLTLALGRGGSSLGADALQLALEGGTPVSGTVTSAVKGGLSVDVSGIRAFCPVSQIELGYVAEPETFVGQTLDFAVVEVREGGKNVILSRRHLLEQQRKQAQDELAQTLEVGAKVEATVKSMVRHGVVVDLGGLDGFIHISELSPTRVNSPEDVVSVGEQVEAKVLSVERAERGLSVRLSLKALAAPGARSAAPAPDEILDGEVSRHVGGGLLVRTPKGEGLVPTRELSLPPGADPRRAYPVGHQLRVVLVNRDEASGRMRFSVSRVADVEERRNVRDFGQSGQSPSGMGSLGDLMRDKLTSLAKTAAKSTPPKPKTTRAAATPASPPTRHEPTPQKPPSQPSQQASTNSSSETLQRTEQRTGKEHVGVTRRRKE